MTKIFTTTLAIIALALPFSAFAAPEIGAPAPDFTSTDISGEPFKLSDHKGSIVVLEWTNHDCPFVKKHYDSGNMQAIQNDAKTKGIKWVTIVSSAKGKQGHVTPEKAQDIIAESGAITSAKILDESGEIGKLYDAKTTPHMFVIDAEGTLAYAGAIDSNSSPNPDTIEGADNYVMAAYDALLAGEAVETTQTKPYGCSVKY